MQKTLEMIGLQIIKFGVVGIVAMAVHFAVVVALVAYNFHPLLANLAGFLIAFHLSYAGHSLWTFELSGKNGRNHRARFFSVAALGFVVNELGYFFLLRVLHIDYRLALVLVLLAVSALTFILSRLWAFRELKE